MPSNLLPCLLLHVLLIHESLILLCRQSVLLGHTVAAHLWCLLGDLLMRSCVLLCSRLVIALNAILVFRGGFWRVQTSLYFS